MGAAMSDEEDVFRVTRELTLDPLDRQLRRK